ncbi:MAG: hypothetical protein H8E32_12625 [Nitrospinae bacterium]|nr:hypothetical protein [Nitrospinota bacterium]
MCHFKEEYNRFDPEWQGIDLKRCQVLILAILFPKKYREYRRLERLADQQEIGCPDVGK